jgi:hypothetical protein
MRKLNVNQGNTIHWQHYTGIFLLSLATLLLELALTRVLSVTNWYHFGFLVVSTALLGFGASGVTLSLWTKLREQSPLDQALASLALLFGFVSLASFWLMQRVPFQPFRLLLDRWQFVYGLLYYVILSAPFFCSGLAISLLLTRGGREVNRLYAADLLGAGTGCAAVCAVMPVFGGSGSIAVVAVIGVLAALAFSSFRLCKLTVFSAVAALGMLALAFVGDRAIPIRVIPEKLNHPLIPVGASPIYTKWNSFSRVEVYHAPALDPERPDPGYYSIVIDVAAGTGMHDLSMGVRNFLAHAQQYHPVGVAYVGKEHPKVLVIGSGGGPEVLEGLYFGASSITAVEINPIVCDIVTHRMREHWGGLFEQPEVRLVTDEGRSFVRRSKEKYDAIISVNTYSSTALTSGALTLSETYILTREAFDDYWNHLTQTGTILLMGYNEAKLAATAREMFARMGLGSPAGHVIAYRGLTTPYGRNRLNVGFLLQKSLLRREEVDVMAARVGLGSNERWGDGGRPEILYSPFSEPTSSEGAFLTQLLRAPNLEQVYDSTTAYLRPATDDKPFFNQTQRWSVHLGFRSVLGNSRNIPITGGSVAQVTLTLLLVQAVVVGGVLILIPLLRFHRQGLRARGRWAFLTYFAGLGLGFILIEIVLLQRLQLFLGQPIYTFSVVLASLLVFTGVGSYFAGRIRNVSYQTLCWLLLAVVGGILLTLTAMPLILSWALGFALPLRVSIAVLLVAPLGILLGVPFPTGLRILGEEASPLVPWAWAVNGFFTVIGSVGAMILGMTLGFTAVFIVAAGCYTVAFIAIVTRGVGRAEVRRFSPSVVEASAEDSTL